MSNSHSTASKFRDLINTGSLLPIPYSFEELRDRVRFQNYYDNASKY